MEADQNRLKEINTQIKLKLAEGDLKGAERLSAQLIQTVEGFEAQPEPVNAALSAVSNLVTTVSNKLTEKITGSHAPVYYHEDLSKFRQDVLDVEHLKLLRLFHYVNSGVAVFISAIFLPYIVVGTLCCLNPSLFKSGADAATEFPGMFFLAAGVVPALMCWIYAGANFWAARALRDRSHHLGCMIISGVNCMFAPFGTMLGILTIMTLSRESVKARFDNALIGRNAQT